MLAVPSQQVLHAAYGGYGKMQGVHLGFGWQGAVGKESLRKSFYLRTDFQAIDFVENLHAFRCRRRIARGGFQKRESRGEQGIVLPSISPPSRGQFLLATTNNIS